MRDATVESSLAKICRPVYYSGMAISKGEATSARMVNAMLELIQSRGYAGTGISTVLENAGAPKGSMYFHFPGGKAELGEKAIGLVAGQFRHLIADAAAGATSPGRAVARTLEVLADLLADGDYQLGCPVSVVTLEMGAHSARLRAACVAAYESWISSVTDVLVQYGLAAKRARDMAEMVVSTVEGAMILSRANRHTGPLASAARVLAPILDDFAGTAEEVFQ
jgi:TetR/AcrR family transcriptional regulator, lmrAB and yxaGH operons repressor